MSRNIRLTRHAPSAHPDAELIACAVSAIEQSTGGVTVVTLESGADVCVKVGRQSARRRAFAAIRREPSRSAKAAAAASSLRAAGVSAPAPYAVVESVRSWGGACKLIRWDVLIMESLCAQTLRSVLRTEVDAAHAWIHCAARAIAAMHELHFFHGDLKATNFLAERSDGEPVLHIVDLEGAVKKPLPLSGSARARDIGRLFVSLDVMGADAQELVRAYGAAAGLDEAARIMLGQGVDDYARRKVAQNRARGRPLT